MVTPRGTGFVGDFFLDEDDDERWLMFRIGSLDEEVVYDGRSDVVGEICDEFIGSIDG